MNIWNEYKTYPIKINNNLWTVYSTLVLIVIAFYAAAAEEERSQWIQCFLLWSWCHACFLFFTLSEMFSTISPGLSLQISRCHIRPVFARYRPRRVQNSAASEHVASWWRGGGCGIKKRATSKSITPRVLLFPHAVTSQSCSWNAKTGCQAATNGKSKFLLKWIYLFLTWGVEEGLAGGHAAGAFDVI